jgi:raffinose/stachyose/melibiose transport system substrate-binding protein
MTLPRWLTFSNLGIVLLATVLLASLFRVIENSRLAERRQQDQVVLRIAHWQMELGYREALQALIDDYQKIHPNVRIEQFTVADKLYGQWLNTHLIAGTAPDLSELGFGKLTTEDLYTVRYYYPLTDEIDAPNPYNAGTELEGVPWRDSLIDAMRGGFRESLQEYVAVPLVVYSMRIFYNREMLRDATGRDQPPATLGEFLDACAAVRRLGAQRGVKISPIVSTNAHAPLREAYRGPFTASLEPECDVDFSGDLMPPDTYLSFAAGSWSMKTPQLRALFELLARLCREFPPGFTGMDRQQAAFMFVQGRAAFLTSGAWDARSLTEQAKGRFTVGVMDFPLPAPGERWAEYVSGRTSEQMNGGTPFGVFRGSPHRDVAIDFLRFLTSRLGNEKFCRMADWPPVVRGAEPSQIMKPFMPNPVGFKARLDFDVGIYPKAIFAAELPRFLNGEITYEQFASSYEQALVHPGYGGDQFIAQEYDRVWRSARMDERLLAMQSMLAIVETDPAHRQAAESRHRRLLQRQVLKNNGQPLRHAFQQIRGKPLE